MSALQRVRDALSYLPANDRDTWVTMGMAVKSELGEDGFNVWDEWSRTSENYKERDARAVWKSIHPDGGVTGGTLFHEARQRGYKPNGDMGPTAAEIEAQRKDRAEREAQARAEQETQHEEGRRRAAEIIHGRPFARAEHPYLSAKGVRPFKVYELADGRLAIPMRDEAGKLWSLQFISPDGSKLFLKDAKASGLYCSIGAPQGRIIVCEGYATGASIYQATRDAVAVAFSAGNLLPVAKTLRAKYPDVELVIAADNDAETEGNPGLTRATEAARAVGGRLAVPVVEGGKDFNDLHQKEGEEAVRQQIAGAKELAAEPERVSSVLSPDTSVDWPELQAISSELYSVEPLHPEIVPEPYRAWVGDIADRMQCPPDFVAATAIVITGAVIGAGCGVRPKREDDWLVIPNLWGGVIGRPSMLKTPAINEAMRPLSRLELAAKKSYDEAQRSHEADIAAYEASKSAIRDKMRKSASGNSGDMESAKRELLFLQEPQPPTWRRFKTNDATIEKMSELLSNNPRGLLLFRDELVGLLATWDKEGHETDRAFYLESWNGYGSITTDRIGRGTTHTENLCVSVFGGIQPAKLVGYLYRAMRGHENDGLMQRIQLLVYPDELKGWNLVDRYPDTAAKNRAFEVIEKLADMDFIKHGAMLIDGEKTPFFRFDPEAQKLFYEWWTELERDRLRSNSESIMLEHLGKYRSLMPSLALIFHLIEVADGKATGPITIRAARQAAAWCECLESHAKRIYGMVSNMAPRAASILCQKIRNGALLERFSVRDVYRKGWELLDDREVVQDACDMLVSAGWLREVTALPETGRPPSPTYIVNPKVLGGRDG